MLVYCSTARLVPTCARATPLRLLVIDWRACPIIIEPDRKTKIVGHNIDSMQLAPTASVRSSVHEVLTGQRRDGERSRR
jgi:hypothetical protein